MATWPRAVVIRRCISLLPTAPLSATSLQASVNVSSGNPFTINVVSDGEVLVVNSAILVGQSNSTVTPVGASSSGIINQGCGEITTSQTTGNIVQVIVNTTCGQYVGARFAAANTAHFYGVWEYPWSQGLTNTNVSFDLDGLGNSCGINWDNARSPFFITSDGYGVYADTLEMGSFDFTIPGNAQFVFNTSSLVYYIILPNSRGDLKSIIQSYASLSSTIQMPPDSGYGPTFWSDDFEEDFHAGVTNAQENYYDVINHLYYNQIHATSMFADRPYGTGNNSWGNFDFDPAYYPSPQQFIANLSAYGFDFQVWVANRAFLDTELFNVSVTNGWLFPGIDPEFFLGPALNLSIPAAYEYFKERLSYFPSIGVKGYKIDRGEEGEMPEYEQNIQSTLFQQLCYETMVEVWGESGFYDFARNAIDRSRSRTYVWNGDSHSNFTGLAYSVASSIRAGLIGFPIWASDTGGYVRGANDPTEELWARWMHFSAFSPVYELMLGTNHTPYYPPYTSDLLSIMKETSNLHHSLLPYIRSYAYQASQTGIPIVRALFLESGPSDTASLTISDQYFFGSELLVAPIITPGGNRSVYFPHTLTTPSYLEYLPPTTTTNNNETITVPTPLTLHAAGTSATLTSVPLHRVPVYVRAGSIVPRGDIMRGNNLWTAEWVPSLTIECYPGFAVANSSFAYYNGETREQVLISMETEGTTGTVKVRFAGDLGPGMANGTVVVFTKTGERRAGIMEAGVHVGGGEVVVEMMGVESLFD